MWKHFFDEEKRYMNPYIAKMDNYKEYIIYVKEEMNNRKNKWNEFFKNDNPIYIEIGSGAGNFSVRSGEKNRNENYIGMELRFKRLVNSAEKAKKRDLENVCFLRRKGEEITECFGKEEINGVHINFPEPWDKNPRRRVVQKSLFDKLENVLKKDGKIFIKTDHNKYYDYVLNLLKDVDNYTLVYKTEDLHNSEKAESNVLTEFEELFTRQGIKTNYIEIKKEV